MWGWEVGGGRAIRYKQETVIIGLKSDLISVFHWPWPENDERWIWVVTKLTYPLNNTSFCCSVFLTVVIAGER